MSDIFTPDELLSEEFVQRIKREHCTAMPVIDPEGVKTGVYTIFIPWEAVYDTLGVHRMVKRRKPHPSLCMLYQRGKCRASTKCNQVHAKIDVVAQLRAQRAMDCCLLHGDIASNDPNFLFAYLLQKGQVLLVAPSARLPVPWVCLARTACLDRLMERRTGEERTLCFTPAHVCRLHQEERCRFGHDCHHIHICRKLWVELGEDIPSGPGAMVPSPLPTRQCSAPNLFPLKNDPPAGPQAASQVAMQDSAAPLPCGLLRRRIASAPVLKTSEDDNSVLDTCASLSFLGSAFLSSFSSAGTDEDYCATLLPSSDDSRHSLRQALQLFAEQITPRTGSDVDLLPKHTADLDLRAAEPNPNALAELIPHLSLELPALQLPMEAMATAAPEEWPGLDLPVPPLPHLLSAVHAPPRDEPRHCPVLLELTNKTVQVPLGGAQDTLADVRQRLGLDSCYVFVVDSDIISLFEERYIRVASLEGAPISLRSAANI